MSLPTLNVIGAGRAGGSIAGALVAADLVRIGQVVNSEPRSTDAAARRLGGTSATLDHLERADWWLIGVPDDALATVAGHLRQRLGQQSALGFHLSGAREADVLGSAFQSVGVFHPVRPFPDWLTPAELSETFVGLTGKADARATLESAARALRMRPFTIPEGAQGTYHAACSMASNFLVPLVAEAERLFATAGLPPDTGAALTCELLSQALAAIRARGAAAALTGPIVRGDAGTVARQLASLPEDDALFRTLARATLAVAETAHRVDEAAAARLRVTLMSGTEQRASRAGRTS